MKKYVRYYWIVWGLLAIVFNAVVFLSPSEWNGFYKYVGAFWPGYIMTMTYFIIHMIIIMYAFNSSKKELFLRIPAMSVSFGSLVVMTIVGLVCMFYPNVPVVAGVVVGAVLMILTALPLIKRIAVANIVSDIEEEIRQDTQFVYSLTAKMKALTASVTDEEDKKILNKAYETVRYSDPRSSAATKSYEETLTIKCNQLQEAVAEKNSDMIRSLANDIILVMQQRNTVCKMNI